MRQKIINMFFCGCGNSRPVEIAKTVPFEGQKPGTSGLRKKTKVFMEGNYLANFVQATFNSLPESDVLGGTFLVSGDGRFFTKEAIQIICEIAAGNGASRVWVGQDGICSTPAASCIIREREDGIANGGFILTASHNPGGENADFGIKYNFGNGAPAPEYFTDLIFENTKTISEIKRVQLPNLDVSIIGRAFSASYFEVEVIDPVDDYLNALQKIFNFSDLKSLIAHPKFSFVFDGLNGVSGPYAKRILGDELGAKDTSLLRVTPLADFGGLHPDPNLTYAHDLVEIMHPLLTDKVTAETPMFGAACDGDADRNMILGRGFFVTPSDSIALIASYASKGAIPYYTHQVIRTIKTDNHTTTETVPKWKLGFARSMPTSCALDHVGKELGVDVYEVPTGWKFFGNLMDAGKLVVCGEESFGTGSDHVREKDGIWAVLCWLSIIAFANKSILEDPSSEDKELIQIKDIVESHWKQFGRNYYSRYDYEEVTTEDAKKVFDGLYELVAAFDSAGVDGMRNYLTSNLGLTVEQASSIVKAVNFCYTDPIDQSVSKNQGIQVYFEDGSRFVVRLSGTGSSGATIRVYLEKFEKENLDLVLENALVVISDIALAVCGIERHTGRNTPSVIT